MNKYNRYKPSGIEWIGEIPEPWRLKRLKYIALVQPSNVDKKTIEGEEEVLLCNYMDVYKNEFIDESIAFMKATATPAEIEKFGLEPGDVLATKDSETPDDIANPALVVSRLENVICAYHLTQIRPDKAEITGPYLFRLFQEDRFRGQFEVSANGVTRYGLSVAAFSDAYIPLPSLEEQTAIASFLDEKTAQIDELVAKKQQLIELLKEERTALINQAVTKGIDPNVKLRASGIDWLGEIPQHWEVKKLKYVAEIKYGLGQPPKQKQDGLPLIRATNVERGKIVEKDLVYVDPEDVPYERDPVLRENDIIVVRSGAYTADSAIIPKKFEGAITGYDMVVRATSVDPILLSYCLLSKYILIDQLFLSRMRAAQPHLNKEELGDTLLILPASIAEQTEIANQIERQTNRVDETIVKVEREIELLQEYRTALISEVITGKVKVI